MQCLDTFSHNPKYSTMVSGYGFVSSFHRPMLEIRGITFTEYRLGEFIHDMLYICHLWDFIALLEAQLWNQIKVQWSKYLSNNT